MVERGMYSRGSRGLPRGGRWVGWGGVRVGVVVSDVRFVGLEVDVVLDPYDDVDAGGRQCMVVDCTTAAGLVKAQLPSARTLLQESC